MLPVSGRAQGEGNTERLELDRASPMLPKIHVLLTSSQNMNEIAAAITQARKYDAEKKSYRIITPYDAQRAKLEAALKASKLPWEDKVFCVDSFQG